MSVRRSDFAEPTVAANNACAGLSPISRTAREITHGMELE